jgi:hypothetical protein
MTATRNRPAVRREYQVTAPPTDGTVIVVPVRMELAVYWDDQLRRWVLVQPRHIETLNAPIFRWRRERE